MGLLSKEVEVNISGRTQFYYENLGYLIPRKKDIKGRIRVLVGSSILVKVEDLPTNSSTEVDIECDGCGEELKNIRWVDYLKQVKKNGKYYCLKCARNNYRKWISFEQWCIENNRQDVLDRWDYELNNKFPSEITYKTHKEYYFKCPKKIHDSELKNISDFVKGHEKSIDCKVCNSFAQWGIDNLGEDFLEKYWDYEKNIVNPWKINKAIDKIKVYIKCQEKDYHRSYDITPKHFFNSRRCPYCTNRHGKIHPLDSLGKLLEDKGLLHLWSDKNKKSPYEFAPFSPQKVYWECLDRKHEEFIRKISDSNSYNFRCPECSKEREESFLQEKIRIYLNSLNNYKILHERKCTVIAQNPKIKNKLGKMPYDNEIKELRLIIEVHGIQHYEITGFHKKQAKRNNTSPQYELHKQKSYDRYKRIFAKSKKYHYLEIPYWTDDNEETWKKLIDNKINEIINMEYIKRQNKIA